VASVAEVGAGRSAVLDTVLAPGKSVVPGWLVVLAAVFVRGGAAVLVPGGLALPEVLGCAVALVGALLSGRSELPGAMVLAEAFGGAVALAAVFALVAVPERGSWFEGRGFTVGHGPS